MILKRIYEEYGFNIESLLIKESKRLKLSTKELNILLVLFSMPAKKRIFSFNSIVRKVDYTTNELSEIIESLMEKEFLKITMEVNNKREREVYELDGTFIKIEQLFKSDEEELIKEQSFSNISETISLLEEKNQRMLRSNELDRIRTWYDVYDFAHQRIIDTINSSNKDYSVIYLEKILNLNITEVTTIDSKADEALDNIFKKL